ncbi:EpsG family protein [Bergeyella sp. RCAD1439]|uniref:EpsG family protein n=1 Tax=Bergeyella anatis TaxID=3113737 RepID=UPI002E16DE0E|nr:EpsG family protein [Bergeyella sp. RCAD1439]
MGVYLFCFALFFSLLLIRDRRYFYAVFIVLFGIMGLRDMVGSKDIYNYAYSYEMYSIRDYLKYDKAEIGFQLYTIALKTISDNRYFYFFVTSFVIGFLQLFSSWNLARSKVFYWVAFIVLCRFYLLDFIVLRQLMCIGVAWLALGYFYHGQRFRALLFFLIALTLHRSALILIPTFFLLSMNLNFRKAVITYGLLLLLVFSGAFFVIKNQAFYQLAVHWSHFGKLAGYVTPAPYYKWIYLVELPMVVAVLYFLRKKRVSGNRNDLFNLTFGYGALLIVSIAEPILIRMAWFFFLGFAYALSLLLYHIRDKKKAWVLRGAVVVYFSMIFFRFLFFYHGGDMLPYKSIFDDFDRKGDYDYMEYRK